jgi:chromosome segregation ATPase
MYVKNCLTIAVLLGFLIPEASRAIELYKYINEDGITVLDSRIPSKYVKSGYTIISSDGRVIEVVARALTEQEIIERDKKAAMDKQRQEEMEKQAAEDATLMRLYSTPGDVVRARDSKLATINSFINSANGNMQRYQDQKRDLEAEAADIERTGGEIPQDKIDRIKSISARIDQIQKEIDDKMREIETLKEKYARDFDRVKELHAAAKAKKSSQ